MDIETIEACQSSDELDTALSLTEYLNGFHAFRYEYEAWLRDQSNDFSLITSMLKPNDEVNLHSRLLFTLLNPRGPHNQGSVFAQEFLATLGENWVNWLTTSRLKARRERDRIDINLNDGRRFVIIENKLNAPDQPGQVRRYIQHVQANCGAQPEDILLIFLAKGNRHPSEKSLGGWAIERDACGRLCVVDQGEHGQERRVQAWYQQISYDNQVLDWIGRCENLLSGREDNGKLDNLRFTFREYRFVVEKVSGITRRKNMALDAWIRECGDPAQIHQRIVCAETISQELGRAKAEWLTHAMTVGMDNLLSQWAHHFEPAQPDELGLCNFEPFKRRHAEAFFSAGGWRDRRKGRFWRVATGPHAQRLALAICIGESWLHIGLLPLRDGRVFDGTWDEQLETGSLKIKTNPIGKKDLPGFRSYGAPLKEAILQMTPFESSEQAAVATLIASRLFGEPAHSDTKVSPASPSASA